VATYPMNAGARVLDEIFRPQDERPKDIALATIGTPYSGHLTTDTAALGSVKVCSSRDSPGLGLSAA
jgi:hypothetical protein